MTSFIVRAHIDRPTPPSWKSDTDCPFCRIIRGDAPCFKVYETDKVIAFLDILPLRPGHTLIIPKTHYARVSELPTEFAAALGQAVSHISHALTQALDNTALNIVCNQEYAQAVHHVHYHVIPAPKPGVTSVEPVAQTTTGTSGSYQDMLRKEFEARHELVDDEAETLLKKIVSRL